MKKLLRKKKNKSEIVIVQVIDKSTGKYKVLNTIGSSSEQRKIEQFVFSRNTWD
jgi:hypothetical protein